MKKVFTKQNVIIALVIIFFLALVFVFEGINKDSFKPVEQGETIMTETPVPAEETLVPTETEKPEETPTAKPTEEAIKVDNENEITQTPEPEAVVTEEPEDDTLTCYMSVVCHTVLDNMDKLKAGKESIIPADGVIFPNREVTFNEGESVFNVLLREMKRNKIHMEYVSTPIYNAIYIEGINNLYEFDCGDLSGWLYKVNGVSPSYGSSRYTVSDGDVIEWIFTCDLGRDVGGNMNKPEE